MFSTAIGLGPSACSIAAGLSDALDGWLARVLNQRTLLGQYLDPIADKLLLSSLFLVLSIARKIPWKYTVLVLSRDVCILATAMALYATVGFRDFRPSVFGKINTVCQIGAVFFVVLAPGRATTVVFALKTSSCTPRLSSPCFPACTTFC